MPRNLLFLLLLPALACALSFDLTADAAAGLETGLYDPVDSTYSLRAPFLSGSAEPMLSQELSAQWSAELGFPVSTVLRTGAGNDWSAGPALTLLREQKNREFQLGLSGEYTSQTGTVDPDQSTTSRLYRLSAEWSRKEALTTRFSYFLTRLSEVGSERRDLNNRIRYKISFKPSKSVRPSLSAGTGYNYSSMRAYRYFDVNISASLLYLPDDRNSLFLMAYGARRIYPGETTGGKKKGKDITGTVMNNASNSTDIASFSASWSHSISSSTEAVFSYDFSLYRSNLSRSSDASHKVSGGLSWHLN